MVPPTVIVEVEDNSVSDTHVIGSTNVAVIVLDWDLLETDPDEAKGLLKEVNELPPDEITDPIRARLEEIIEDDEDEDDEDDEDEDEDEDEFCDECGEPGCKGECCDDDEDD